MFAHQVKVFNPFSNTTSTLPPLEGRPACVKVEIKSFYINKEESNMQRSLSPLLLLFQINLMISTLSFKTKICSGSHLEKEAFRCRCLMKICYKNNSNNKSMCGLLPGEVNKRNVTLNRFNAYLVDCLKGNMVRMIDTKKSCIRRLQPHAHTDPRK